MGLEELESEILKLPDEIGRNWRARSCRPLSPIPKSRGSGSRKPSAGIRLTWKGENKPFRGRKLFAASA
jgi:hypothetical protein